MRDYAIISDTSSDLPQQIADEFGIDIVPCYISLGDNDYVKEGTSISRAQFFAHLSGKDTKIPKTAAPSPHDFYHRFCSFVEEGKDILCVCLSSRQSGLMQAASIAKDMILTEYPDSKVEIVDSCASSMALGLLLIEAAKMRAVGMSMSDTIKIVEEIRTSSLVTFTINDFKYMIKSGRMKNVQALTGEMLNLRPIICLRSGEHNIRTKVRGNKKALRMIIRLTKEFVGSHVNEYTYAIINSKMENECKEIQELLYESLGIIMEYPIVNVGCTIATHVGPNAFGVAVMRKYTSL